MAEFNVIQNEAGAVRETSTAQTNVDEGLPNAIAAQVLGGDRVAHIYQRILFGPMKTHRYTVDAWSAESGGSLRARKSLKSLALPRGIEPLFQP
jgi:hypothetical protein